MVRSSNLPEVKLKDVGLIVQEDGVKYGNLVGQSDFVSVDQEIVRSRKILMSKKMIEEERVYRLLEIIRKVDEAADYCLKGGVWMVEVRNLWKGD
ncbi:MAG: hypothetical protein Ta2E_10120 [Mycoplasmoidaceae bacterium]|nr:MAG: hypothetical protein Ta2E_10120 [Mycoplasmoidaceae bacterium]